MPKKHHHHHHHHRHDKKEKKHKRDSSEERVERFAREDAEERAAARNAERLESDEGEDGEAVALEKELEEAGELTEVVRSDGRREKVVAMEAGSARPFVVEDGHLSEGEKGDLDRELYAPVERIDRARRRRHQVDEAEVQRVLERELAELREDSRRIAERSSSADSLLEMLRARPERPGRTDRERFLLWAEMPVIKALQPNAYDKIKRSNYGELKRYVAAQAAFAKETIERAARARRALRPHEPGNRFEEAFKRILLPPQSGAVADVRCEKVDHCTERNLRCSFTDEAIEEGAEYHELFIDGTRYNARYALAARLVGLSKFCSLYQHVEETAKRRSEELDIPTDEDLPQKLQELFSDEEWLSEITSVYEFGIKFCDEVARRWDPR